MREKIHSFLDNIFDPPTSFLELAIDRLQGVNLVTAQGLDLSKYLAIFGDMPQEWQLVIQSLFVSLVLLGTLILFRSLMRLYFALKEGVKWW